MSTSDYKSVRVPVIPLDYNSRFLAEKKEILFDYNTGQLYVVSAKDKNIIFNITDVVLEKVQEGIDLDNLIINVEGIGDINLSEYIEYLNKYNLTLSDNDSKQYYAPTVKFDNMSIILCDGEATVSGFKHAGNGTYVVKQDNQIKWVPIPDGLNVPTQDGNGAYIASTYLKKAGDTVTGILNVPTQAITDHSTKVANTAFVQSAVDNKVSKLVNSAPATLDTLNELSNALGNDPNFATTVTNMIGQKADKTGTGASGTWGIDITGYAGALSAWKYRPTTANNTFADTRVRYYIASSAMNTAKPPRDGTILHLPWDNGSWDTQLFISGSDATVAVRAQNNSADWSESTGWKKLAFADDVPVKNGTGASGTWNIGISGNAATATKATNDGNGNVIADTYLKKAGDTVTGTLNVPTQAITDNSTKVANTAFVQSAVDNKVSQLVNSAPATLDTLNELSNALGNDPNFATTVTNMIGQKEDKTSVDNKIALHNTDSTAHTAMLTTHNADVNAHEPILTAIKAITGMSKYDIAPSKTIAEIIPLLGLGGIVAQSLGKTGYVKFANGLTIQWGETSNSTTKFQSKATFPISFTTVFVATGALSQFTGASSSVAQNIDDLVQLTLFDIAFQFYAHNYIAIGLS